MKHGFKEYGYTIEFGSYKSYIANSEHACILCSESYAAIPSLTAVAFEAGSESALRDYFNFCKNSIIGEEAYNYRNERLPAKKLGYLEHNDASVKELKACLEIFQAN